MAVVCGREKTLFKRPVADPGGPLLQRDPILSFSHVFAEKHPSRTLARPQREILDSPLAPIVKRTTT